MALHRQDSVFKAQLKAKERFDNKALTGLTTAFLVALVKAVGQPVALPPSRDTLPISAHEVSRDVALCGEVIP